MAGNSSASSPLLGSRATSPRPRVPFYAAQRAGTDQDSEVPEPLPRKEDLIRRAFYYIPALDWLSNYSRSYLLGDLAGGLSLVCVIVPIALSYASNLAKIPPIYGLYAAAIGPSVYAIFGSCAQMNVGPEGALSLLVGETIRSLHKQHSAAESVVITGVVTFLAGSLVFVAGILRLGFLDSVLSRSLLRGFISAVAVVIFFDQSITVLGLNKVASHMGVSHFSPIEKAWFVLTHLSATHRLTALLSFATASTLFVTRWLKRRLSKHYSWVIIIPDILLVVMAACILTASNRWDQQGIAILGHIEAELVAPKIPIRSFKYVRSCISTAILVAILGFFETVVAGKTLGNMYNYTVSPNREMIALGIANMANSCFGALPVFASYSRSKINISAGARTQMSAIFSSIAILLVIRFLMPLFYYLPKAVLSSTISVIMFTLLQEAPADIRFFWKVKGYADLMQMALVFFLTLVASLEFGITVGVITSLIRVIKHSQSPRIQILGRLPGTKEYVPVDGQSEEVEHVDGFLIVRIPEPLIFANTGQLKDRLRRLEKYGDSRMHPSMPASRSPAHNERIIFDCEGMSGLDAAAAQILAEIVDGYIERGIAVYFARLNRRQAMTWALIKTSGIYDRVGGERCFVKSIHEIMEGTGSSTPQGTSTVAV
ncbi:sulfate transporter family-domain-containing protein [Protomyces lactucae-debilis]|uniref:Sulfate transporter family-domain-containing protein n=1 Tax=Protomyces lactucae-debilis TaxID=2754530 RepID=A0A1Y2FSJ6_PROLT|nr:sulfate transporter family-domain-containing protein [Protomyces lactucae-debilis]ORY86953.1 sulfate transporter family-domain-containing protein [Protomyces lactucae-debilis]